MPRDLTVPSIVEFFTFGTGPFASTRLEGTYTFRSKIAEKDGYKHPDVFTYILAHSTDDGFERDMGSSINTRSELLRSYYKMWQGQDNFFQLVTLPKPHGHGVLKLKDSDPMTPPLLDPKYLQDQRDVDTLVEGKHQRYGRVISYICVIYQ
jgi:choline dehydrogenase-like flavoprotein